MKMKWRYVNLNGFKMRISLPGEDRTDPDMERLGHQLDRFPSMLREAREEGDAVAINWLETLQQAVRTE